MSRLFSSGGRGIGVSALVPYVETSMEQNFEFHNAQSHSWAGDVDLIIQLPQSNETLQLGNPKAKPWNPSTNFAQPLVLRLLWVITVWGLL